MQGNDQPPEVVRLRLLQEQPVQGCDVTPVVYLSNGAHNPTDESVHYSWKRCVFHLSCSSCSKSPVSMQCIASGRYYCSAECFKLGWPTRFAPREDRNAGLLQKAADAGVDTSYGPGQQGDEHLAHKWMEVSQSLTYTPSADDVGRTLRLVCTPLSEGGRRGASMSVDTNLVIAQPPPPPARRRLVVRNDEVVGYDKASGSMRSGSDGQLGITVCTYNVLADLYALSDTYPYCPAWALAWAYRRRNLLRDMQQLGADVFCLQEVQADHYEQFFEPHMDKLGYSGVYKRKTREFMGQYGKMDGCALFYRRDKLVPVDGQLHAVEFNTIAVNKYAQQGTDKKRILNRLLKDNVAQVGIFSIVGAGLNGSATHVCVANTHINANTEFSDVKLWQTQYLLLEIERIVSEYTGGSLQHAMPIVIAGDFNSTPGSSPYTLMQCGYIARENLSEEDPAGILASLPLEHHMLLRSAHTTLGTHRNASAQHLDANGQPTAQMELPFSNYTGHFIGTLDYIWYTQDQFELAALLEPADEAEVSKDTALPSAQFPSDHLPLAIELKLRPRQ
mmetsp:Transcript_15098/g.39221  ORF Transcript_15098/g.39221 Transcript_15098/m.39221 type:complete len:560 (-) Transcript_15098:386-2065(-)